MSTRHRRIGATAASAALLTVITIAQQNDGTVVLTGPAAFGDWRQDRPGITRLLTVQDLPAPRATRSATNFANVVRLPAGTVPNVPTGFSAEMVASGLKTPRVIRVAPNGDLFVAESEANLVRAIRLTPGTSKPAASEIFMGNLRQPYGIAFYPPGSNPEWVYIANSDGLIRVPYQSGDLKASGPAEPIVERIPTEHHWTRDVAVSPDGVRLFYSVGSGSNVALDMSPQPLDEPFEQFKQTHPVGATWDTEERRADVLSFDPDGKNERIVATGLRNCSGLSIQPATGQLWCVVNERDDLGDNTPFEYATVVKEGAFYGWPWFYIGNHEDPRHPNARPDLKNEVTIPSVLLQAHSAPMQIVFYEADAFPQYKGSAFVTMHGSWNRGQLTGYKVVRLPFVNGKATGEYQDFMTGFVLSDRQVWGRPVGIAVANDGSLIVTEDASGTIWRVFRQGTP